MIFPSLYTRNSLGVITALLFLVFLVLVSCSGKKERYLAVYTNDMDNYRAWLDPFPINVIHNPNAYSGKFVCRIDSVNQYSPTLQVSQADITDSPPVKLIVSAWIKMENTRSRPFIVVEIKDREGVVMDVINQGFTTKINEPMRWTKLTGEFDLTKGKRPGDGYFYKVYLNNESGSFALVDDILICFQ